MQKAVLLPFSFQEYPTNALAGGVYLNGLMHNVTMRLQFDGMIAAANSFRTDPSSYIYMFGRGIHRTGDSLAIAQSLYGPAGSLVGFARTDTNGVSTCNSSSLQCSPVPFMPVESSTVVSVQALGFSAVLGTGSLQSESLYSLEAIQVQLLHEWVWRD